MGYRAYRESIVANNTLPDTNNVCPGGATFFVLKHPLSQPVIQSGLSALELREVMVGGELFRRTDSVTEGVHLPHGALVLSRRASRGLLAGGLSSMAAKRLNSSSGNAK